VAAPKRGGCAGARKEDAGAGVAAAAAADGAPYEGLGATGGVAEAAGVILREREWFGPPCAGVEAAAAACAFGAPSPPPGPGVAAPAGPPRGTPLSDSLDLRLILGAGRAGSLLIALEVGAAAAPAELAGAPPPEPPGPPSGRLNDPFNDKPLRERRGLLLSAIPPPQGSTCARAYAGKLPLNQTTDCV